MICYSGLILHMKLAAKNVIKFVNGIVDLCFLFLFHELVLVALSVVSW